MQATDLYSISAIALEQGAVLQMELVTGGKSKKGLLVCVSHSLSIHLQISESLSKGFLCSQQKTSIAVQMEL